MSTTLVVNGGPGSARLTIPSSLHEAVRSARWVIAADSGCDSAQRLGLRIDALVGDLDSVSDAGLRYARAGGAVVVEYPPSKDRTDFELAMALAVSWHRRSSTGPLRIVVLGTSTGRVDHLLAMLGVLTAAVDDAVTVDVVLDSTHLMVLGPGRCDLPLPVGSTVSLVALTPGVRIQSTSGLRWSLREEALDPFAGRGIANVVEESPVVIDVDAGRLLVLMATEPFDGHRDSEKEQSTR